MMEKQIVELYSISEEGGCIYGFYVKGEPKRKEIVDAIEHEFPDFYEDFKETMDEMEMRLCYVRIVPVNPHSDSPFSVHYYECEKGRGAMRATRLAVNLF